MRAILSALLLCLAACSPGAADGPVADTEPNRVIETALNPYPAATTVKLFVHDLPLGDDGRYGISRPSGTILTERQRLELASAFSKVEVRGTPPDDFGVAAACFIPHHFFRYFDSTGKQVGEIEICFCCDGGRAIPELVEQNVRTQFRTDIAKVRAVVEAMELPVDVHCD